MYRSHSSKLRYSALSAHRLQYGSNSTSLPGGACCRILEPCELSDRALNAVSEMAPSSWEAWENCFRSVERFCCDLDPLLGIGLSRREPDCAENVLEHRNDSVHGFDAAPSAILEACP